MPAQVTVAYPWETNFKKDYYLSTHMPLVQKSWAPHGLKKWEVLEGSGGPDGSPTPYKMMATLHWDSQDDFKNALGQEVTKEVLGDIPNFSDKQPTITVFDVAASS